MKLLAGDLFEDVDLRTTVEQRADRAAEGLHMVGLAMDIESGLVLIELVVYELVRIVLRAMQHVLERAGLRRAHRLDHFACGLFELLLAAGLSLEFGYDGNRHRILLGTIGSGADYFAGAADLQRSYRRRREFSRKRDADGLFHCAARCVS